MFSKPQSQHEWLMSLVGDWDFTHECIMGPGQPPTQTPGKASCRALGGLWVVIESSGQSEQGSWSSIMSLGFDEKKDCYVGTFIGSMMSNVWVYEGQREGDGGKQLVLNVEGPAFDGNGTAKYQDIVEIFDRDHWALYSQILLPDGSWSRFLNGQHHRVASTGH